MAGNATTSPPWPQSAFGALYDGPSRNGLMRPKAVRGSGVAMVNMGEIFAHDRIGDVPMERVPLSEAEAERFLLQDGDLLFARASLTLEGAGKVAILLPAPYPRTFESHIIRVRLDRRRVTPSFYYYFFRSPIGRTTMTSIVEQVSAAGIRASDLATLPVPLPPLPEQRAIAGVLGALDDKIEVNRKTARVLEGIARAVFTSWFVDFDPVRRAAAGSAAPLPADLAALFPTRLVDSPIGEVPEGWRVGTLASVCKQITSGGTPDTQRAEFWGGGIPWLSSGETRKKFVTTTEKTISKEGVANSSTRLVPAHCTVIASAGQGHTRGQTSLLLLDTYINQSVVALIANPAVVSDLFLFFDLERRYEEFRRVSDSFSSRGSLTTKLLAGLTIAAPPLPVLREFDAFVTPIVARLGQNSRESATLAALRDALLPKLISGELRIADAEKIVGRAV